MNDEAGSRVSSCGGSENIMYLVVAFGLVMLVLIVIMLFVLVLVCAILNETG